MNLVAVVLNWNGGDDTLDALASLGDVPAICVDNGSTDGSDELVETRFPGVELLRNRANLGFAGGNNIGISRALERGAQWVLLLNNDAIVEPGAVTALEDAAAGFPDAGILACVVLNGDGTAVQYAGGRFNARLGYSGRLVTDVPSAIRDTGRADGAAFAVSAAAIERVGGLDESLFMYVEDVEWSLRVRKAGFSIALVPEARVLHKGSASSGGRESTTNLYYSTRNTIAVCERYAPMPRGAQELRRGVVVATHLAQAAMHPSRRAAGRAVIRGWRAARAGEKGPGNPPMILR